MDELAEVDSDDERDWSVRGGARRGRSRTPRPSRHSSRDLSLSRHASREPSPAGPGKSRTRAAIQEGLRRRVRQRVAGPTIPEGVERVERRRRQERRVQERDGRRVPRLPRRGSSEGSSRERAGGAGSAPPPSPRPSGRFDRRGAAGGAGSPSPPSSPRSVGKVQSEERAGGAAADENGPGRRSPTPGMALQDLSPGSPRGRAGQSPLSRSPRSASPAQHGGRERGLATVSDSALMRNGPRGRPKRRGAVRKRDVVGEIVDEDGRSRRGSRRRRGSSRRGPGSAKASEGSIA